MDAEEDQSSKEREEKAEKRLKLKEEKKRSEIKAWKSVEPGELDKREKDTGRGKFGDRERRKRT